MGKEDMKMNFKGAGSVFCLIAAILAGARYIAAALYASNAATISEEVFGNALLSVGPALLVAAIAALVIGVCFLVLGFVRDGKKE